MLANDSVSWHQRRGAQLRTKAVDDSARVVKRRPKKSMEPMTKAIDAKLIKTLRNLIKHIGRAQTQRTSTAGPRRIQEIAKQARQLTPQGHLYNGIHSTISEVLRFSGDAKNAAPRRYEQLLNRAMRSAQSALAIAILMRKQPPQWDSRRTKNLISDLGKMSRQADAYSKTAGRGSVGNIVKLFGGLRRSWLKLLSKYPELSQANRKSTVPHMMKPDVFQHGGKGRPRKYFGDISTGLELIARMVASGSIRKGK